MGNARTILSSKKVEVNNGTILWWEYTKTFVVSPLPLLSMKLTSMKEKGARD
jgi:hypothetical protein